ncbi:MAG: sulfate transporter, inner rane subunit [Thermoleophilia bacterium]|nr:sulfate transporter, inner rane subunit [Thermoleophilia bacterium]
MTRYLLRCFVIAYVLALILGPLYMVFSQALDQGTDQLWTAITTDAALHALKLTILATVIATVVNTIFGIACALMLVRRRPRGSALINAIIDLPFAVSPIVVGLALLLTFGIHGWFGEFLTGAGLEVIYAVPGIVIATVFVTLPFVVREVVPVLEELGDEQEQAASTLGASSWRTFWSITLPSIRWGVAYGVVLTVARALGEYGAVAVVSGKIAGRTETMTTHIEERYQGFDTVSVYGSALVLASLAILVLGAMMVLSRSAHSHHDTTENR